jgi:hypothetical protein
VFKLVSTAVVPFPLSCALVAWLQCIRALLLLVLAYYLFCLGVVSIEPRHFNSNSGKL